MSLRDQLALIYLISGIVEAVVLAALILLGVTWHHMWHEAPDSSFNEALRATAKRLMSPRSW